MFTGLIEEVGKIRSIKRGQTSAVLSIEGSQIMEDVHIGDSIAVNGVCLTASQIDDRGFTADVMHETLNRSSLGKLSVGSSVNLERAMAANGRFGGHMVSGHIDGTGTISEMKEDDNAVWIWIDTPEMLMNYIVEKGSIAIDGISLTVAKVEEGRFAVSIIPHTFKATALGKKQAGDIVNLENDIIGNM